MMTDPEGVCITMVSVVLFAISAVLFVAGILQQKKRGGKEQLQKDVMAGLKRMSEPKRRRYQNVQYDQWDAFFDIASIVEDDDD